VKLSTQLMYAGNPREAADQVKALEEAGLDTIWVAEAYGFDSPTLMGYLAAKTERVEIGSAILNIYSRTPGALLQTAAGLDNVSQGRAIIGLGASGPQVIEGFHGVPYDAPLGRTREIIEICRKLWAREEKLTYDGKYYDLPLPVEQSKSGGLGIPLKIINHPVRANIPIHVASLGPKNVELTAELAEGWVPILYLPEKAKAVWGDSLARGLAKRPAELGPMDVIAGGPVAIGDDVDHLRERARPNVTFYVGGMGAKGTNFYNDLARRYGYEAEAEKIQDLYLAGHRDEAAAAVPDDLLEKTSLIGSAGYVKERIAAYRESGVTVLSIAPMGDDPVRTVAQLKEWVS
jgi:F420-dependent oxidoreductase-like protein